MVMDVRQRRIGFLAMVVLCIAALIAVAPHPIPQDQQYHRFADSRPLLGIPNFADVASSLLLVIVGIAGLVTMPRTAAVMTLSVGAVMTGFGSAYYHWTPTDGSLLWDRLGIVVTVAAFIALLMEHFEIFVERATLLVALLAGIGTLLWWLYAGDLRQYAFFQGFPFVLFVLGSLFFPRKYPGQAILWLVMLAYAVAKICELLDPQIYAATAHTVSGHTLKHVLSASALAMTILWINRQLTPYSASRRRYRSR
jgi:nicotinamide riboside transporter PnuC